MRDIERYERDYLDNPFEAEMIGYRHSKTLETLQAHRPKRILEVGCGLTPLYHYYSDFDELLIFEPSQEFANNAEDTAPDGVEVVALPLQGELASNYAPFDLVVISSLLHELEKPAELLENAKQYAGDDCIFHINVPNANSLHRILALRMGLIEQLEEKSDRQLRFQQHHTFSTTSLRQLVQSAGLTVESVETFFIKPFTHTQMQQLIDNGIASQEMLDGLYQLSKDLPDMGAEIVMNARL